MLYKPPPQVPASQALEATPPELLYLLWPPEFYALMEIIDKTNPPLSLEFFRVISFPPILMSLYDHFPTIIPGLQSTTLPTFLVMPVPLTSTILIPLVKKVSSGSPCGA